MVTQVTRDDNRERPRIETGRARCSPRTSCAKGEALLARVRVDGDRDLGRAVRRALAVMA
jgi:hypothetical protein